MELSALSLAVLDPICPSDCTLWVRTGWQSWAAPAWQLLAGQSMAGHKDTGGNPLLSLPCTQSCCQFCLSSALWKSTQAAQGAPVQTELHLWKCRRAGTSLHLPHPEHPWDPWTFSVPMGGTPNDWDGCGIHTLRGNEFILHHHVLGEAPTLL